ncbi:MAG: glycosyltransferase family 4 protein [Candidatus Stahlbacteria bacterium]|nr:glycosyltransferase family 4 protein [Candidatus Stahlbacteria bacterium]
MKIAVVGVEATKTGGTERFTYELVNSLGAELFASTVVAESRFQRDKLQSRLSRSIGGFGGTDIKFHKIPKLRGPDIISKNLFPLFAQLIVPRSLYDIIISEGVTYFTPSMSIAVTSQRATLDLLAKGELFFSLSLSRYIYWRARVIVPYILERILYSRNIPVVAISNLLKQELVMRYKVKENRVFVVYPGVDLDEFRPDPKLRSITRRQLNLTGDVLIFVGSQWGRKGLKYLFNAIRNKPKFTLLVVGGVNEQVMDYPANVRFIGYRSNLCELYNAADIFVFPSLFDAFGLTVLEAMACGIPVVVSKIAGASEIVGDGGVIINNPRDPQEIMDKILITNLHKEEMGKKARLIAENYSWNVMGTEIRKIISK